MRILVTGGAGFIGRAAVRHFTQNGDDVLNVDRLTYASRIHEVQGGTFMQADIADTATMMRHAKWFCPDVIVNFAAETHVDNSIEDCSDFVRTNVGGTSSLLSVCRQLRVPFCHVSTDEVYGPASDRAFTEADRLSPQNPYAATKAAADMMVQAFRNTYAIDYLIVRPSNNYGPGQHPEKFIPKLLSCLKHGKTFPLYGVGDQEREWTYVEDTVRRIRKLLNAGSSHWNKEYNLSSGVTMMNVDAAYAIIRLYNEAHGTRTVPADVILCSKDRPGHDRKYWIDQSRIESVLRSIGTVEPYTTFESGISETIRKS